MPNFILTSGVYAGQTLQAGQTGIIGRDAAISSMVAGGIQAFASAVDVRVLGQILTVGWNGIDLAGSNNFVSIGATGMVETSGSDPQSKVGVALWYGTGNQLINEGRISGNAAGVLLGASAGGWVQAANSGAISGKTAGLATIGDGVVAVQNAGSITGTHDGVTNLYGGYGYAAILRLTNTGAITGADFAVRCGDLADVVINRGLIEGNISLGDGADRYDGRRGLVTGTIDGGAGADTFTPGAEEETILGGAGSDTLNFFAAAGGVHVALDGSLANTGLANGDSYESIEVLRGSNAGADILRGAGADETLWGNGGNDTLGGADGADALIGGIGIDRHSGGGGNDSFVFNGAAEGGDLILDFAATAGNDDRIVISAAGFGAGLAAGALAAGALQVRSDNLAQDGDDRFIFRTTDKTLWFDADGNGAAASVMLADLQAGAANLGAGDIWLV